MLAHPLPRMHQRPKFGKDSLASTAEHEATRCGYEGRGLTHGIVHVKFIVIDQSGNTGYYLQLDFRVSICSSSPHECRRSN